MMKHAKDRKKISPELEAWNAVSFDNTSIKIISVDAYLICAST